MIGARYRPGVGLEVGELPVPEIGDGDLLVRVRATAICGTDLKILSCGHLKLKPGQSIVLGHEFAGTIERVGSRVTGFHVGMRVGVVPNIGCGRCEMCARGLMNMCPRYSAFGIDRDGSHAEFVNIPEAAIAQGNVVVLPDAVSMIEAALIEPLSCVANGMRVVRLRAGETVLLYGAGPMGLLNLMFALVLGAAQVYVVDPNSARLEVANRLGASAVLNPEHASVVDWIRDLTHGRGVDVVIVAAGVGRLQAEAVQVLAPFGRVCLFAGLANGHAPVPLDTNAIHYKNLVVTGMTGGAISDYRTSLKLIESGRFDIKKIISHVLTLRELEHAYKLAMGGTGTKIVLTNEDRP